MSTLTSYASDVRTPKIAALTKGLVLLGLSCLMLCVPVLNKSYWAAIILIIVSMSWRMNWKILLKDKVIITGLLLAFLFTIGLFYSHGSLHSSLRTWDKYLKIFYLIFFLPLFTEQKNRNLALSFLITGVMISEIFTYLHYFNVVTFGFPEYKHWLFVQDIDSGFVVSFVCFVLANLMLDNKKFRTLYLVCFLICSVDMLLLNQERTGYLIYFALTGLFLLQRFRLKGFLCALVVVPFLFADLYFSSTKFQTRIDQCISNVVDYQNGHRESSIALRLSFAEYSFKVIKQNLIFGVGTGSFPEVYRSLNGPPLEPSVWPTHPHNEYIDILFQLGVTGLGVFILWLYLSFMASFQLPSPEKKFLQGLVVGFVLLGLCNASLLVNPAGACYVTCLAIFLASKYQKQEKI